MRILGVSCAVPGAGLNDSFGTFQFRIFCDSRNGVFFNSNLLPDVTTSSLGWRGQCLSLVVREGELVTSSDCAAHRNGHQTPTAWTEPVEGLPKHV